jgi:hypothetical protein
MWAAAGRDYASGFPSTRRASKRLNGTRECGRPPERHLFGCPRFLTSLRHLPAITLIHVNRDDARKLPPRADWDGYKSVIKVTQGRAPGPGKECVMRAFARAKRVTLTAFHKRWWYR